MSKTRNRDWQSATVRRAFEVVREGDIPPVVVDALAELAAAQNEAKSAHHAAVVEANKPRPATEKELFHRLHTQVQPVAQAFAIIIMASAGPSFRAAVGYNDDAYGQIDWLVANAIGYGLPGFLLPVLYFDRLSREVRSAIALVAFATMLSIGLVVFFGR